MVAATRPGTAREKPSTYGGRETVTSVSFRSSTAPPRLVCRHGSTRLPWGSIGTKASAVGCGSWFVIIGA
jgi:hypothetical protein